MTGKIVETSPKGSFKGFALKVFVPRNLYLVLGTFASVFAFFGTYLIDKNPTIAFVILLISAYINETEKYRKKEKEIKDFGPR